MDEVLQHTLNVSPPCFASLQGFSVRTQLHSISLHTVDKDLREFVVRSGPQSRSPALTIPPIVPSPLSCLLFAWWGGQVEALSQRGHFPDGELQSVAFMRRMEALGSLATGRCGAEDGRRTR